jgi:hypothetical protein
MFQHYIPIRVSDDRHPARTIRCKNGAGANQDMYANVPQNVIDHGLNLNHCVYGMAFSMDAYKSMKENDPLEFLDLTRSNWSCLNLKFSAAVDGRRAVYVYVIQHNGLSIKGSMLSYL